MQNGNSCDVSALMSIILAYISHGCYPKPGIKRVLPCACDAQEESWRTCGQDIVGDDMLPYIMINTCIFIYAWIMNIQKYVYLICMTYSIEIVIEKLISFTAIYQSACFLQSLDYQIWILELYSVLKRLFDCLMTIHDIPITQTFILVVASTDHLGEAITISHDWGLGRFCFVAPTCREILGTRWAWDVLEGMSLCQDKPTCPKLCFVNFWSLFNESATSWAIMSERHACLWHRTILQSGRRPPFRII